MPIVFAVVICERALDAMLNNMWDRQTVEMSAISRTLVGPYGLHAFGMVVVALFLLFLWAFNFTNFF